MKKKFVPSWVHPRFIDGSRCYILVYACNPSGLLERYRNSYKLGRIKKKSERKKRANDIIKKITWWVQKGKLYADFSEFEATQLIIAEKEKEPEPEMLLRDGLRLALKTKLSETDKRYSIKTLKAHHKCLSSWLEKKGYDEWDAAAFSRKQARQYINHWIDELDVSNNNTYNTKLDYVKLFFNWMVDEEIIDKNPFGRLKRRKRTRTKIRELTIPEMQIISKSSKQYSFWMWLATQLAFWGLIRQEELSLLTFKHFSVSPFMVMLTEDITKNGKADPVTLPQFLLPILQETDFFSYPSNYYVFGEGMKPGTKRIHEAGIYKRHLNIMKRLVKAGELESRSGLSFKSWRRAGMDYYSYRLPPRVFKDHNRHDNFSTTERYLPARRFIPMVAELKDDIFNSSNDPQQLAPS